MSLAPLISQGKKFEKNSLHFHEAEETQPFLKYTQIILFSFTKACPHRKNFHQSLTNISFSRASLAWGREIAHFNPSTFLCDLKCVCWGREADKRLCRSQEHRFIKRLRPNHKIGACFYSSHTGPPGQQGSRIMIKGFNEKNCKIPVLFKKEPLGKTETQRGGGAGGKTGH